MDGEFDDSDGDEGVAAGARRSGAADAEAAALEAELAAVAAAEAAAAASLRARAGVERAQARGVANQRAIWERALALRIGLQKALTGAARLPGGAARQAARAAHPPAAAALDALSTSAAAAAEELASLIVALCARHPELAPAVADVDKAKVKATKANRGVDVEALWARVDGVCGAVGPFRDAAFDKWHAKASLAGSAAAPKGGGLRALNQPPSAQVRPSRPAPRKRASHASTPAGARRGRERGQCACHSEGQTKMRGWGRRGGPSAPRGSTQRRATRVIFFHAVRC